MAALGMEILNAYVRAEDHLKHQALAEGTVSVTVTHSNLNQQWPELRFEPGHRGEGPCAIRYGPVMTEAQGLAEQLPDRRPRGTRGPRRGSVVEQGAIQGSV